MRKIFILLLMFLCMQSAYSYEYFNLGRSAYDNGRYGQAKEYLEIAIRNNPKNTTYRYYYALTLSQLGDVEEATKQYQMVAMTSPNSEEGQKSTRALDSMKKFFETKAGEFKLPEEDNTNYMPYIIVENSKIKRWNKDHINVYVSSSPSRTIVEKAFNIWSEKSDGILNFNFVPTKDLADITVTISNKLPFINSESGRINGSISVKHSDNSIVKADIIIQDYDNEKLEEFSPDKIYATALHMIGHAIGLNTHSENKSDIMYWFLNVNNPTISQGDINTLKLLYNINAENLKEIHNTDTMHAIKLNKAKTYAAAYPNLPLAWSGLAAAYVSVGEYENAVDAILKAIDLNNTDPTLYTQLAGFYSMLNKEELSLQSYKTAFDLEPTNKIYLYNWAKSCYKNKKAEYARPFVDEYLMGSGFLANDDISRILRRMYKQDKNKEKEKIKRDREAKQKKLEEIQEMEQQMFVD